MTNPLIARSLFWRYYGSLGRLTLLNLAWGASLSVVFFLVRKLWTLGPGPWVGSALALAAFSAAVVVSVGFGRVAFGVFVEGRFHWGTFLPAVRQQAFSAWVLALLVLIPSVFLVNNLALYLKGILAGSWVGWGLAALDLLLLIPFLLSCVWIPPMLYFREGGVGGTLKRSLLLVLGRPAETLGLLVWIVLLAALYVFAPVLGFLLGGSLLLGASSTALEKMMWGYKIAFQGRTLEDVTDRWEEEADKSWRDILRPWESRGS